MFLLGFQGNTLLPVFFTCLVCIGISTHSQSEQETGNDARRTKHCTENKTDPRPSSLRRACPCPALLL